ncbi:MULTISPECIES: hypothetical protein [unclassified Leclercia]|uniref:Lipoprotein n=1 Tax=Leclercia barmai TaxID=2785629 RepID=A0ABS7S1H3_9ENTR|nr:MULTISPECIES: hypothetical protein [unclassified Leclercia]MBZ0059584.1 hypothetical protein [Leclercia sp. EMC7]MCM5697284.1 hypothetical protein [Leclercia sp. LTM01]MCM5702121.1 hypothetical protein [Leclercia sp. LTM14]
MKRLAVIAAVLVLASCAANGDVDIGTGTGGGLGLGAGLSLPGGKAETKPAPALSPHLKKECGMFAANVHNTSEEAALKMCKIGVRDALKKHGEELCTRRLESYTKEQLSHIGQDHDVFAENNAAYAYGCDVGKASLKGEDLQGNAINDSEEDDDYE